jgi:hypothetical protein
MSGQFWSDPISAIITPVVIIGYFVFSEWRERRTLKMSRKAFADGWAKERSQVPASLVPVDALPR